MSYFAQFPKIQYDIKGDGDVNVIPDIFRRIKLKNKIRDNLVILDKYDLTDGEKPEDVAYKTYGDADYFWVVTLVNNVVNRYYDWPLDEYTFQQYVADKYSNPEWIASDLIAQAEHDMLAQSILITNSKDLIKSVNLSLKTQLIDLPKKQIASKSIKNYGLAIFANSQSKIVDVVNTIAPEHLEIDFKNYKDLIKNIKNAGSIFIGKFSTIDLIF